MDSTRWHSLSIESIEETLQRLDVAADGLTSAEAATHLARTGHNEIARRKPIAPWHLLVKQFASFFVIVLLFAAALAYAISFLPTKTTAA
jgi:magnesium-transporting ATPase (P-type)